MGQRTELFQTEAELEKSSLEVAPTTLV